MKKIYLTPASKVFKVRTESVLNVASPTISLVIEDSNDDENVSKTANGKRYYDDWDDEEDY